MCNYALGQSQLPGSHKAKHPKLNSNSMAAGNPDPESAARLSSCPLFAAAG
jgi:hypothetical protein